MTLEGHGGVPLELRDLAWQDPALVAADLARLRALYGEQLQLW